MSRTERSLRRPQAHGLQSTTITGSQLSHPPPWLCAVLIIFWLIHTWCTVQELVCLRLVQAWQQLFFETPASPGRHGSSLWATKDTKGWSCLHSRFKKFNTGIVWDYKQSHDTRETVLLKHLVIRKHPDWKQHKLMKVEHDAKLGD